jgi:hypothetical protein
MQFINEMVAFIVPNNTNTNQPKQNNNVILNYSTNLTASTTENPMINPNFTNTQSGKTLNPTQQITVIGKGADPEVIVNNPNNISHYIRSQSTTNTSNIITKPVIQNYEILKPSDAVNDVLSQYGFTLSSNDIEKVNSLQPGQSVTVFAEVHTSLDNGGFGSTLKITNLGNGQYLIKSETPIYDPLYNNGQWISINETISIPTATVNTSTGNISTNNFNINGTITLLSSGSRNATKLATYDINESFPITYNINKNKDEIIFNISKPKVDNITLQSIDVPTITNQELQALQNGQNTNIQPGWYYDQDTDQFVKIYYQPTQTTQNIPTSSNFQNNGNITIGSVTLTPYDYDPELYLMNALQPLWNSYQNFAYQQYLQAQNGPPIQPQVITNNISYPNPTSVNTPPQQPTNIKPINTNNSSITSNTSNNSNPFSILWDNPIVNGITTIGKDIYNGIEDVYNWFTGNIGKSNMVYPYLNPNAYDAITNNIPGTTMNYLNYDWFTNPLLINNDTTNIQTNRNRLSNKQISTIMNSNIPETTNYNLGYNNPIFTSSTNNNTNQTSANTQTTANLSTTNQPQILQYSFSIPTLSYTNFVNAYQTIQNWEANNYNQYVQTLTKPTSNIPNIIISNNLNLGNNTYPASQHLQNLELWQEIENNPTYPFPGTNNPYSPFNSVPIITDTTATWSQLQYETNPNYRKKVEKIRNEVENVEWGIQTFNYFSDITSLLGLKNLSQSYQNLAQQAQIYGSPAFYQAESLGGFERAITPSLMLAPLALPLGLISTGVGAGAEAIDIGAEETASTILPRITTTSLLRIPINMGISAGENVAAGEITSYLTTGKPLSTNQVINLAEEGGIMGAFAGGLSLLGESSNTILASIGTQFQPLNFAKNLGINIGGNLLIGNALSYYTSGQPLSLNQDILSIEEAGPMTLAYSTVAGIFESPYLTNNFLRYVTKADSNKYWPIAARVIYDVGSNFIAGTTASLATQEFGVLTGAQKSINLNEALEMGLFTGGLTGFFEGGYAIRNPGEFVKSLGYYPLEESVIDADRLKLIKKGLYDVDIKGKGIVPKAYPKLGNRFYTEADFPNIKPIEYSFDISGNFELGKITAIGYKLDEYGNIIAIKDLNGQGQTYYSYKGNIETTTKGGSLSSNVVGILKAQRLQGIKDYNDYMDFIKAEQSSLEESYPEYKQLRNVPTEGIYLFRNYLSNNLGPLVENVNEGQNLLEAGVNAYFDRYANLAGSRYVSLITASNDLINRGIVPPEDIQTLLETTTKQYNNIISDLGNAKQQAFNEISTGLPNLEVTNLNGLYPYIKPEDLNIKTGKLPNPSFLNRITNRNIYLIDTENINIVPNTISNVETSENIERIGLLSYMSRDNNFGSNVQAITKRDIVRLAKLNNEEFVKSVANTLNLVRSGAITPDEAKILLENEARQYYDTLNYLKALNQQILKANNIEFKDLTWPYSLGIKPYNLNIQPKDFDLNKGFNKVLLIGDEGVIRTSMGETYKTMGEGIMGISDKYGIGTTYQVLKDNYGKSWYFEQQSGFRGLSNREAEIFNYLRGVDPNTLMEKALGKNIIGQPLSQRELQIILKSMGNSKIIAPPYGIIRPYTNYGFSIININYGTNQNAINQNNNYNMNINRIFNVNGNQLESNIIQTQYPEHLMLNEYNIQNELNTIRENLRNEIRSPNTIKSPNININPLKNYGKELYYKIQPMGIQNIQSQRNQTISKIRPLELGRELLKSRERMRSLEKAEEMETIIIPEIGLVAGEIYRLETTKPVTTTITTTKTITKQRPISPPPKEREPTPPPPFPPPTTPPKYPPVFEWPELSIIGQPISSLTPGFGRGVRSMYDIQYALSRLQW